MKMVTPPDYAGYTLRCGTCGCEWRLEDDDHPDGHGVRMGMEGGEGSVSFMFQCPGCGDPAFITVANGHVVDGTV